MNFFRNLLPPNISWQKTFIFNYLPPQLTLLSKWFKTNWTLHFSNPLLRHYLCSLAFAFHCSYYLLLKWPYYLFSLFFRSAHPTAHQQNWKKPSYWAIPNHNCRRQLPVASWNYWTSWRNCWLYYSSHVSAPFPWDDNPIGGHFPRFVSSDPVQLYTRGEMVCLPSFCSGHNSIFYLEKVASLHLQLLWYGNTPYTTMDACSYRIHKVTSFYHPVCD